MKKKLTKISAFQGKYAAFSNFYPCFVVYEGMIFPSAEHAFQAAKTTDRNERVAFAVCPTAKEVKALGRKIQLRPDWEEIKVQVMTEVVRDKFVRNQADKDIKKLLLSTGDALLEEANSHGDRFWGTVKGEGQNWLGKILMQVRGELQRQEDTRERLIESWDQLLDGLYSSKGLIKEAFQTLFLDTWNYLSERVKGSAFSCADTALISRLACFPAYRGEYPKNIKQWEFDTCSKFVEGILKSISQMDGVCFTEGVILVEIYYNDTIEVKLCDFQKEFEKLCDTYLKEVYDDEDYDEEDE